MIERAETNLGRILNEDLDNGGSGLCSTDKGTEKQKWKKLIGDHKQ
jgi:hypothetical protein